MDHSLSSTGPFGWEILSSPTACNVDIIILHGLNGGRRSTFTHKNGRCWPQDFLPRDLPYARIMTFGYDANVVSFGEMAGQNSLEGNAKSLLEAIVNIRSDVDRPLIFITYSLGGLLCKKALLMAQNGPGFRQIFNAYVGIMFIGTPHKGSKQAKLGGYLASLVNIFRSANKELVKMLDLRTEMLLSLDNDFWVLMDGEKKHCRVHCYNESAPVTGLGIIVDRESASRPGTPSSPLDGTHKSMLKFATNQDAGYRSISSKLVSWARDLPTPQASSAPVHGNGQSLAADSQSERSNAASFSDVESESSVQSHTVKSEPTAPWRPSNSTATAPDGTRNLVPPQTSSNTKTPSVSSPFNVNNCEFKEKVLAIASNNGPNSVFNLN